MSERRKSEKRRNMWLYFTEVSESKAKCKYKEAQQQISENTSW